ncbi:tyrosine kinase family protein, partial [Chlamydia psittaci C1/97]
SSS